MPNDINHQLWAQHWGALARIRADLTPGSNCIDIYRDIKAPMQPCVALSGKTVLEAQGERRNAAEPHQNTPRPRSFHINAFIAVLPNIRKASGLACCFLDSSPPNSARRLCLVPARRSPRRLPQPWLLGQTIAVPVLCAVHKSSRDFGQSRCLLRFRQAAA